MKRLQNKPLHGLVDTLKDRFLRTVVRVVIKRNFKALRETGSSTALHSLKLIVFTVSQVCLLLNVHLKTNMSYDEIMLFSPMIEKIKQTPFLPPPCTLNALDI